PPPYEATGRGLPFTDPRRARRHKVHRSASEQIDLKTIERGALETGQFGERDAQRHAGLEFADARGVEFGLQLLDLAESRQSGVEAGPLELELAFAELRGQATDPDTFKIRFDRADGRTHLHEDALVDRLEPGFLAGEIVEGDLVPGAVAARRPGHAHGQADLPGVSIAVPQILRGVTRAGLTRVVAHGAVEVEIGKAVPARDAGVDLELTDDRELRGVVGTVFPGPLVGFVEGNV